MPICWIPNPTRSFAVERIRFRSRRVGRQACRGTTTRTIPGVEVAAELERATSRWSGTLFETRRVGLGMQTLEEETEMTGERGWERPRSW